MHLGKKKETLELIKSMSAILNDGDLKLEDVPGIVLQALDKVMGFQNSVIYLTNEQNDHLICVSARGNNATSQSPVPLGGGIIGTAALIGDVLRISDPSIRSQLAIPLNSQGTVIGVLSVQCEKINAFDEYDENLLTIIANQTMQVMNVVRIDMLNQKRKQLLDNSIQHLHLLQKYMEALTGAVPEHADYTRASALQIKGLAYLAMGESQLAYEQLELALNLSKTTDLPLEFIIERKQFEMISDSFPLPDRHDHVEPLTKREMEVARLTATGLTNAEIAERLYISERTVATHLERMYRKLNIRSRAALAHYILRPNNDTSSRQLE